MHPVESEQVVHNAVVLLVDDQQMVGEGIRRMLEGEENITFHYCDDPAKAIEMAIEIKPSVILQDLVMPDVDGMTLMRFYKNHPDTMKIPVIVLSSKDDAKIKSDAFNSGANDYLVKMPNPIELVARIRAHSKHYLTELDRDIAHIELQKMQQQLEQANIELESRNKELQLLSCLDGLTGIANRRKFDEIIENEWRRAQRKEDAIQISLILIDVDNFKLYNDHYGHIQGDDCLKQVAWALSKSLNRASDYIARYGGEEFVAVLVDTPQDGAMIIAEKMRQAVQALVIPHNKSQASKVVTCSFGVASSSPKDTTPEQLIEAADKALYRAKGAGRDQIVAADK